MISGQKQSKFTKEVLTFYQKERRSLPWRSIRNPYRVLVSEVMLQQTQADRVVPYYKAFLKNFPTIKILAEASLLDVLRAWQGLGYNRRAKMLHEAAKLIIARFNGRVPNEYDELIQLPGVGDYTARAVRVFAFGKAETLIETNIRTVYLDYFFKGKDKVSDKEILPIIEKTCKGKDPHRWYSALMDYGAYLKKTTINPSRRSKHHTKQSVFKGSDREIRGAIIRTLTKNQCTKKDLEKLPFKYERINEQLERLQKEELIEKKGKLFCILDS